MSQLPEGLAVDGLGHQALPLGWRLAVAHEVVDVMQECLGLGEVGMA